jgi:pimeloyl-ACP methyl ester carboxylesterase
VTDPLKERLATDWDRAVEFVHGQDVLFYDPDPRDLERSKATVRRTGCEVTEREFLTCDRFDVRDRLGGIDAPAIRVHGEHDRLTPPRFHEFLAEHLADAELIERADAAHLPFIEGPAAFDRAVTGFLEEP